MTIETNTIKTGCNHTNPDSFGHNIKPNAPLFPSTSTKLHSTSKNNSSKGDEQQTETGRNETKRLTKSRRNQSHYLVLCGPGHPQQLQNEI